MLEFCSSPTPLWKPSMTFFCVGHLYFSTCTHPHLLTTQRPRDQMLHMVSQELRYGFECDWVDWLSCWRTSCQSTCTYTMPLAKKDKEKHLLQMLYQQSTGLMLEARSRQASRASYACGVLADCAAKRASDAAPFSCTQSRQAFS